MRRLLGRSTVLAKASQQPLKLPCAQPQGREHGGVSCAAAGGGGRPGCRRSPLDLCAKGIGKSLKYISRAMA